MNNKQICKINIDVILNKNNNTNEHACKVTSVQDYFRFCLKYFLSRDNFVSCAEKRAKMAIFSVYVVNKAGGLIYQYDNYVPRAEAEKTFSYPLDLVLKIHDEKVVVSFGQRDGIRGTVSCQQQSTDHMKAYKNVYSDNW